MVNPAEPIVLHLSGHVPSKKNSYTPQPNGKGFFKNQNLQTAIDRLAMQIPGEFRDLNLVSPEINFHFVYERANWDRDGAAVTLLDILVQMSVLKNDNLASCNGLIQIHPAVRGDQDAVTIVLIPQAESAEKPAKRYVQPRRERRILGMPLVVTESPILDSGLEPLEDEDF